jgi:hypothetical protein
MFLSIVITILILAAFLCTLLVALSTEFFTGRAPEGPDAMATATPILAAIVAWIVTLLALWCLTARGVFQWIGLASPVVYALVTLVGIGLAFAMAGAFGAWLERLTMAQPLAAIPGVLLPLVLQGFILMLAWMDPAAAGQHHVVRLTALILVIGAVGGWVLAAWAAVYFGGGTSPSGGGA